MLIYLDADVKIALKKMALDRRCHAYEIVEELVREHLQMSVRERTDAGPHDQ